LYIASDPTGKVYRDLIDCAFHACNEFLLVIRPSQQMTLSEYANTVLDRLSPFLIENKYQFVWPGTRIGEGPGSIPVSVHYYRTDEAAKKYLLGVSESLYSWQQPRLPEDLCFLKNRKPWLSNSAHESQSYFTMDDQEDIDNICNIKNLILCGKTSLSGIPRYF